MKQMSNKEKLRKMFERRTGTVNQCAICSEINFGECGKWTGETKVMCYKCYTGYVRPLRYPYARLSLMRIYKKIGLFIRYTIVNCVNRLWFIKNKSTKLAILAREKDLDRSIELYRYPYLRSYLHINGSKYYFYGECLEEYSPIVFINKVYHDVTMSEAAIVNYSQIISEHLGVIKIHKDRHFGEHFPGKIHHEISWGKKRKPSYEVHVKEPDIKSAGPAEIRWN